jgi:GWxTD domain-containing protein
MNYFLSLLFSFFFLSSIFCQNKELKAYIDYKTFYTPSIGNYAEIQMQFLGHTLNYQKIEEGLQGELAVILVFKKNDEVVQSDAYRLKSPVMKDSIIEDFFEIKRFALHPGNYDLEISFEDLNSKNNPVFGKKQIKIKDVKGSFSFSDIQVSEVMIPTSQESTFSKSGYDMLPRISNYFPSLSNSIPVYFEMYTPDEEIQTIGLKQTLINLKTKQEIESFTRFSKHEFSLVQPIIRVIDITKLYSGEYKLEYSLISKENQTLNTVAYQFERTNDELEDISIENIVLNPEFQKSISDDSVLFYLASLMPIIKNAEYKNLSTLLKSKDIEMSRKYIQSFWSVSSKGSDPFETWLRYKSQVLEVQKLYANNFMKGFETDRGRVYLQYGSPNSIIIRENSPSDYPYEIWQYDKILQFSNKRFVFYNPDLVTNNHRLLHSDLVGEIQNYRWQQHLSKRNSPNRDIDDGNDGNSNHYGGNSRDLFRQF